MRRHAHTSPRKVRCISGSGWKKRLANEWRSCCQWSREWLLCLTGALPWHLAALMSFPGIGTGSVEGLLNWGSGTLPSEAQCAASQRWTLGLCGARVRHVCGWPVNAAWGCPAACTSPPQTCHTLALHSPGPGASRPADYHDPSSWTFWVSWTRFVQMNKTLLGEWEKSKQKQKRERKKKFLCLVGANQYFIFHAESRIWA